MSDLSASFSDAMTPNDNSMDQFTQAGGLSSLLSGLGPSTAGARPSPIPSAAGAVAQNTMEMLMDVSLQVTVELGRTRLSVRQVLDLQKGSVVELNRIAGDAVDIFVNDRLMARGEVVVVDDKFGVRITELVAGVDGGEG